MDWLNKAKDKARDAYQRASDRVSEETVGTQSTREKALKVGSLIQRKVTEKALETHGAISKAAMDAHDQVLLMKHGVSSGEAAPVDKRSSRVRVTVVAAADLRPVSMGELDPYCMVTVGRPSVPWAAKIATNPHAKMPVCLRQRHPRWDATCVVPLKQQALGDSAASELTVRIMDAHTTRADSVLGEARVDLSAEPSGARTVRLLGGGFASLSLRWFLVPRGELDPGPGVATSPPLGAGLEELREQGRWSDLLQGSPFEGANAFWAAYWAMDSAERPVQGVESLSKLLMSPVIRQLPAEVCASSRAVSFPYAPPSRTKAAGSAPAASPEGSAADERARADGVGDPVSSAPGAVAEAPGTARKGSGHARGVDPELRGGVDELLLQAPLTSVLCGESVCVEVALHAIASALEFLRPLARSRIIGALVERLQAGKVTATFRHHAEELMHQCFVTLFGEDLRLLKQLIDTAGTGHDLLSMFSTIVSPVLHASLLEHFRTEGSKMIDRTTHVLSDIDMTVWVGAFGTGGPKFPQGPIPGAISLFGILGGRITFLSARPPVWESRTRSALLNDIGIAEATVLQGTLQNVAMALVDAKEAHKGMGEQKEKVFKEFAALHPEARFVFFGDSGEGDVEFAANFAKESARSGQRPPDRIALIHDVVDEDGLRPKTGPDKREMLSYGGVYVFDTYAGAAEVLYKLGILDEWDLRKAAQNCADEFAEIPESAFFAPYIFRARQKELSRDLHSINATLGGRFARDCPPTSGIDLAPDAGESGQELLAAQKAEAGGGEGPTGAPVAMPPSTLRRHSDTSDDGPLLW